MQRFAALSAPFLIASLAAAQFVTFDDVTASGLALGPVSSDDTLEKDFDSADFDQDGWADVICARKTRFSNPGVQTDVLLMNRSGRLVNETAQFAPGFLTNPTDARDVRAVDVNLDGWVDLVFCNTFSDQPVLYINLGNDGMGDWQGFVEQSNRIPNITTEGPLQFCAVWSGDLTGNGAPDLYFCNYNPGGATTDALLINDGTGVFTDETAARMNSGTFGNYARSAFGTDAEFHDVDNDGDLDIVKLTTLFDVSPFNDRGVFILFNNGNGFFNTRPFQEVSDRFDPYMFEGGDLNNDGMMDFYAATDSNDSYRLATSVTPDGPNTYTGLLTPTSGTLGGFGGNVHMADFDNDSDLDLMVSPIDTDIQNCEAGGRVVFLENTGVGSGNLVDAGSGGSFPWETEAFDFQFFDLNNDGRMDVLLGNCTGYTLLTQPFAACSGDCNSSGSVDFADLVSMLFEFGTAGSNVNCDADMSGGVDFSDLVTALFAFGPCP